MKSKVIYTAGIWDLLHWGHIKFLEGSKKLGDYLLVGVHTDEVASSYKRKPILCLEERMRMILALEAVDEIIIAPAHKDVDKNFFDRHNISIQVHADIPEKDKLWMHKYQIENGLMKYIPYTNGISTTNIIDRCRHLKRSTVDSSRYEIDFLDLETLDPNYSGNVVGHLNILEKHDKGELLEIEPFEYYEEFHIMRRAMLRRKKEGKPFVWDQEYMSKRQLITLYERMKSDGYSGGAFSNNFMWAGKRKDGTLRPHGSHRTACLIHMYRTKHPKSQRYVMVCIDKERKDKLNET